MLFRSYIIFLIILLICSGCAKKETNPVSIDNSTKDSIFVLFADSFEENGSGSINSWNYYRSRYSRDISFSSDVPLNGGSYSLVLQMDSTIFSEPYPYDFYLYRTFHLDIQGIPRYFVFKYWIKGLQASANIDMWAYSSSTQRCITSFMVDGGSQWKQMSDTIAQSLLMNIDSLRIDIGIGGNSTDKFYLDNIQIIELTQ
jgi:hypothetical protein